MTRSVAPELLAPPVATTVRRRRFGRGGPRGREGWWALLFLAPTLLGLLVLSAGPIVASFGISLTDWDLLSPPHLRGAGQLRVAASPTTGSWSRCATPPSTRWCRCRSGCVLALGLALALDQRIRGIALIRTMYFLPLVTSTTAIGLVWLWIYSPQGGLLNTIIGIFGIPAQKWVSDPVLGDAVDHRDEHLAGPRLNVIIFLAGLQAIPQEYYDAAAVDGAGRWARFRNVTLPLLTPSRLLHRDPRVHRLVPGVRPGLRARPAG